MKEPADGTGGQRTSNSFGRSLAQRAIARLPYLQDAATREPTPEEAIGLAWAAFGLTYAEHHALSDESRATLDRLEAAIDAGTLRVSNYAAGYARRLIDRARYGDRKALERMVAWAEREGV